MVSMQPPLGGNEGITLPQRYASHRPCLPSGGKQRMPSPCGAAGGHGGRQKAMVRGEYHEACVAV